MRDPVNTLMSDQLQTALVENFGDGRWHRMSDATDLCGHLIPPELAIRRAQAGQKNNKNLATISKTQQVETGRRWGVAAALRLLEATPGGPGVRDRWARFKLEPSRSRLNAKRRSERPHMTEELAMTILKQWYEGGVTQREIAAEHGFSPETISLLVRKKTWTHLVHPIPKDE